MIRMKQSIQKANARSLFSRCAKKVTACVLSTVLLLTCFPLALAAEPDTDPLTAQELTQMTDEQIAALSQEQSDATLNKMAQLFQDGEKQALDEYLSALGFATTYEEYAEQQGWNEEEQPDTEPSIQPMWQSDYDKNGNGNPEKMCHETMTGYGFLMYIGAMNQLFGIAGSFGFTLGEMTTLSTWSGYPDTDPKQVGALPPFGGHFYDPDTGESIWHSTTNTAKTNGQKYYDAAISYYNSGNRSESLKNLSYAIHYVQDVMVPHHSANKASYGIIDLYNHSGFEKLASKMLIEEDAASNLNFNYEASFYQARLTQSVGNFIHEIASASKQFINVASDKNNEAGQRLALAFLLPNSMYDTSGILYKFAKDVGMI